MEFKSFQDVVDAGLMNPLDIVVKIPKRVGLFISDYWHDESQMLSSLDEIVGVPMGVKEKWRDEITQFSLSLKGGEYRFQFSDPDIAFMFLCRPASECDLLAEFEEAFEVDENLLDIMINYISIKEDFTQEYYRAELIAFYRLVAEQNLYLNNLQTHIKQKPFINEEGQQGSKRLYTPVKRKMFSV